ETVSYFAMRDACEGADPPSRVAGWRVCSDAAQQRGEAHVMRTSSINGVVGLAIGLSLGIALQFDTSAAQQSAPTPAAAAPTPNQAPAAPGRGRGGGFTEPSPIDFNDHEGY